MLAVTEPLGPGLDPDAMAYLHAAGSLAHRGVLLDVRDDWVSPDSTRPLTRWPPGFSVAIAGPIALGASPVPAARFVMALAAFITLAALAWVVSGAAGVAAGAVTALVLLVTPAMAIVHESVLSEPLFLATLALTLAAMVRARPGPLVEGAAAAAASMVRYAGLSAIGAVVLWELTRAGPWRDRARRTAIAAAPGALVNAWWWARAAYVGGRGAVRDFSVYGEIGYTLREGAGTGAGWLAPVLAPPWSALLATGVVGALVITAGLGARRSALGSSTAGLGARHSALGSTRTVLGASALIAGCYLGLVLAARVLADPNIPLDERILVPAMVFVTAAAAVPIAAWWRGAASWSRVVGAVALVAWGVGSVVVTRDLTRYALETGNDYADICWRGSPVIAWVREHGAGHALLSNASVAVFFQADRVAREMPTDMRADLLARFADTLAARRAYVVLFDQSCASTIEQPDSLVGALGLVAEARLSTGSVWRAPERPPPDAPR